MGNETETSPNQAQEEFAREAEMEHSSMLGELWHYFRHSKKWWLVPIVLVLVVVGALVLLGGTAAAPFIYTLF